jgi:hypothetical protein
LGWVVNPLKPYLYPNAFGFFFPLSFVELILPIWLVIRGWKLQEPPAQYGAVSSGFACWPFFARDRCLENVRTLPEFELLVSSLQTKYPDHLGLL